MARRAAEAPERPWLFHPRGLDWSWLSRGEMARRVGRLAVALAEPLAAVGPETSGTGDRPHPPAVAYPYRSRPLSAEEAVPGGSPPPGLFLPISAWVVHLALGAAGFVPMPLSVRPGHDPGSEALAAEATRRGAVALALPGAGTSGPGADGDASRWLDVRQLDPTSWRILSRATTPDEGEGTTPGVEPAFPSVSPVSAARRLLDLGGRAPGGRGGASGGAPGDEVAVAGRGPADAGDRLLVAWSLLTGGVLLLEANPDARVATAAFARPTLFLGDGAEVARLGREAAEWEKRWRGGAVSRAARWLRRLSGTAEDSAPGPPFGRLHTLVLRDAPHGRGAPATAAAPAAEGEFWSSREVRRVDLASLVQ